MTIGGEPMTKRRGGVRAGEQAFRDGVPTADREYCVAVRRGVLTTHTIDAVVRELCDHDDHSFRQFRTRALRRAWLRRNDDFEPLELPDG